MLSTQLAVIIPVWKSLSSYHRYNHHLLNHFLRFHFYILSVNQELVSSLEQNSLGRINQSAAVLASFLYSCAFLCNSNHHQDIRSIYSLFLSLPHSAAVLPLYICFPPLPAFSVEICHCFTLWWSIKMKCLEIRVHCLTNPVASHILSAVLYYISVTYFFTLALNCMLYKHYLNSSYLL